MKKKLIALAVAGAMTAPMAALADMSVSGQLQTQIISTSGKNTSNAKGLHMTDGGAASGTNAGSWGALTINASEDLGGGLKALAHYGFNITTDNAAAGGNIGTRSAYVGIAGDFGAVLAGRMNHPYKTATIGYDPFVGTFMQARFSGGMGGIGGIGSEDFVEVIDGTNYDVTGSIGGQTNVLYGTELDNTLAYAGNFNGVKVVAGVIMDESPKGDKTNGKHAYAASVTVPAGPVEIAAAYASLSEYGGGAKNTTAAKIGAKYSAGDLTIAGHYEMLDKGWTGKKGNVLFLSGSYAMGANTISASMGRTSKELIAMDLTAVSQLDSDDVRTDVAYSDDHATYAALGFSHAFSQKTNVFAGARQTRIGSDYRDNSIGAGLRVRF